MTRAVIVFAIIALVVIYLSVRELLFYLERRLLKAAEDIFSNSDYEGGISYLDRYSLLFISKAGRERFYCLKGGAFFYLKRYKSSAHEYERALALNPYSEWLYRQCGIVYLNWEKYRRALHYFDHAVKFNEEEMESYYLRGLAYELLLQRDEALRDYSKAIELEKEDESALYRRALLYRQMDNHSEAYEDLKLLLWRSPYNADYLSKMAVTQYRLGMFEEAEESFSRALKKEPNSSSINYERARFHYLTGDFDSALSFIDSVLESGDSIDNYLLLKALIMVNKSEPPSDDSFVNTELLDSLKSSSSISRYELAILLILLEDYRGAFEQISLEKVDKFEALYKYIYYYIIAKLSAETVKEREALKLIESEISSGQRLSWPYSAAEYLTGKLAGSELNSIVDSDPLKQCEANFYMAIKLLGEAPACEIKEALEKVIESKAIDNYEYQMARYFLNNFELISDR